MILMFKTTTICMIEAGPEFVINVFPSTNFTVKHIMCVVKSYKIFKLALNNYDIKQHVLTVKIHAFGWFFWNVCLAERYITQRLRKHFKLDFERQTVTEKAFLNNYVKCVNPAVSLYPIYILYLTFNVGRNHCCKLWTFLYIHDDSKYCICSHNDAEYHHKTH